LSTVVACIPVVVVVDSLLIQPGSGASILAHSGFGSTKSLNLDPMRIRIQTRTFEEKFERKRQKYYYFVHFIPFTVVIKMTKNVLKVLFSFFYPWIRNRDPDSESRRGSTV
jgi:hypothetical protein